MKVCILPITDIVIQSPKKFEQTIQGFQEVSPFARYTLSDAVISNKNKYTLYANSCTVLGMSNGKNTYLGHFAPELKMSDFKDRLDNIVKKFKDQTGQLTAIITGAFDHSLITPRPKDAVESFTQMAEVGEVLDKNNAVLSMIGGKRLPLFMDNLAVTSHEFILSHTPKKAGAEPMRTFNNTNLEEFLSEKYSVSEINPQHTINYRG